MFQGYQLAYEEQLVSEWYKMEGEGRQAALGKHTNASRQLKICWRCLVDP